MKLASSASKLATESLSVTSSSIIAGEEILGATGSEIAAGLSLETEGDGQT
jgi:hypothetical protein